MRQAINNVYVEGILKEINLNEGKDKNGKDYLSGNVVLLVDQEINGTLEREEIQVDIFTRPLTNAKTPNPSYANVKKLMDEGVSVAAIGDESKADIWRIDGNNGGDFSRSEYDAPDGRHITRDSIRGSFFRKVTNNSTPNAQFEVEIVISDIMDEVIDDTRTGRLKIKGIIVGYNDRIDVIDFIVENPAAVAYVHNNWYPDATVNASGFIRSTLVTRQIEPNENIGFGEPVKRTSSRIVREFVITAGTAPYDDEIAYNVEDVRKALVNQKARASKTSAPAANKAASRGF